MYNINPYGVGSIYAPYMRIDFNYFSYKLILINNISYRFIKMEWRVNVYIDEKYIKEYFEKTEYDSNVSVKNLEIGDVVILINDEPEKLYRKKNN